MIWLALVGLFQSRVSLEAEVLALRHQLNVLRRKSQKKLTFTGIDRLVFAGVYRLAPGILGALAIVRPDTVIRYNHADGIASMDLFVVPTILFRLLYGLLVLQHDRRQGLWLGVTAHPPAEWISRRLTEAYGWKAAPRYMIRDRDAVYGDVFIRRLRAMGIRDRPTAPRSPWQNGYCERAIGRSGGNVLTTLSCSASGISAICCDLTRSTTMRRARTCHWIRMG